MANRKFKFFHGIPLGYNTQGLIYFICHNYKAMPGRTQRLVLDLCRACGGDNAEALFEFLTTDRPLPVIMQKYYIASQTTIYRAVNKFYVAMARELDGKL
jgi:hypothetical protein